jgi:two-component system chemotaxis response regulator CheY
MKILVVEDDHEMRKLIVQTLKTGGYDDFVEASNGMYAVRQLNGVDLVLTDINMPAMGGTSLVKELRNNPRTEAIPIVAITSDSSEAMVHRLLRMNINGFVVKPFDRDVLLDKVDEIRDDLTRRGLLE